MFIFAVYIILLTSIGALIKIIFSHYEGTKELLVENYNLERNFKFILSLVVIVLASCILFNNFCCN